jgi:imidazolonepropionase-like amidohydrolase
MKEKNVWLVPTFGQLQDQLPKHPDRKRLLDALGAKKTMLQTAREIGVRIANGYDPASAATHGTNAREIISTAAAGFTNLEAIRSATLDAAELIGWQGRIGSLESGKFAGVIAVAGNPLVDIRSLEHVPFAMKGGVVVKSP